MIFIDACYRKPTVRPPVWIMRQAGRYLPEYREIRAQHEFIDMCRNPELVKEVTLQPIRRFGMDAAIIFSDILLPLTGMGLDLFYREGEGPVIENPIQSRADVDKLKYPNFKRDYAFLGEAIRRTGAALDDDTALIGFAGAPFTLACYAVQGRGGGHFEPLRRFMFREPKAFDALLARFAEMTIEHLTLQVEAGARAIQLFDTWGGLLSGYDYLRFVFPHVQKILNALESLKVPRILFIKNATHFRGFLRIANAEVIGLDWTMPFEETREILGDNYAVQGNMDPMYLFADVEQIRRRTLAMIELNHGQSGYIVNLGHGIHKETPIAAVEVFVKTVKEYRSDLDQ